MPILNRLKEHHDLMDVSRKILRITCQVYNFKEGTKELPEPNGCGILLEYKNSFYCFSNAHVLADNNLSKTFILLGGGKTMTIGGQYFYSKLPISGRQSDPLDVTVVHLTEETAETLKQRGYDFLNISQVLTGYKVKKTDYLMVAGYPASQMKIDNERKKIISKPFLFKTKAFTKSLARLNFHPEFHIAAKYSRNKIFDTKTGNIKIGPKPNGISGSGLWLIKRDQEYNYRYYLLGIFSEYLQNRALLISTKIDIFIDIIRQKMDSTIPNRGVKVVFIND